MSESTKWNLQGSRVYGNGRSFNCTNKITAEQLYNTLNTYEQSITLTKNTEQQYDRITKQIIQLKLSIGTLTEEINTLHETIQTLQVKQ